MNLRDPKESLRILGAQMLEDLIAMPFSHSLVVETYLKAAFELGDDFGWILHQEEDIKSDLEEEE